MELEKEAKEPAKKEASFFYIDAKPTLEQSRIALAKDNAAEVLAVQVQGREAIDANEAKEIVNNIINGVVEKLDAKKVAAETEEEIEFSIISAALFDLTEEELAALHKMDDEITEKEE